MSLGFFFLSIFFHFSEWFLVDIEVGMVMRWYWVRGGEFFGPFFQPRMGLHHHFPIIISCL